MAIYNQKNDNSTAFLESGITIAVLSFGFFTASTQLKLPTLVSILIFASGLSSLVICVRIVSQMRRMGQLSKSMYRSIILVFTLFGFAFLLSVSPEFNAFISELLVKIGETISFP